jgi:Na+/H+ antiporter NhaD/arsenite permease-like protein
MNRISSSARDAPRARKTWPARLLAHARRDPLLAVLALLAPALLAAAPLPPRRWLELPDWPTLAALAGLLVLTRAIELSGYLQRAALILVRRVGSLRGLALALVSLSAALATVLTNDVTLFLTVPLAVAIARVAQVPIARLVIFEALAVNCGSMLTPIGNPQNLYLWHRSGLSIPAFVWQMAAPTVLSSALLIAAIPLAFERALVRFDQRLDSAPLPRDQGLLAFGVFGLLAFLVALQFKLAYPAMLVVLGLAALFARPALRAADWSLLAVIALMFLALGAGSTLPAIQRALAALPLAQPRQAYLGGVLASQLISNVPAAILLAPLGAEPRGLAYGVNLGGFGLALGSLANLIALRLAGLGAREFHRWSLPFLALAALAVYWLLPAITP